jgi:hypothetical protein
MVKIPMIDVRVERDPDLYKVMMWLREGFLGVNEAVKNALVSRYLITALVSEGASSEETLRQISNVRAAIALQLDELNRVESRLTGQPIQPIQAITLPASVRAVDEPYQHEEDGNAQEDTF